MAVFVVCVHFDASHACCMAFQECTNACPFLPCSSHTHIYAHTQCLVSTSDIYVSLNRLCIAVAFCGDASLLCNIVNVVCGGGVAMVYSELLCRLLYTFLAPPSSSKQCFMCILHLMIYCLLSFQCIYTP